MSAARFLFFLLILATVAAHAIDTDLVYKSIVKVKVGKGHGSGFVISEQGHIITNHHVVSGAENGARVEVIQANTTGSIEAQLLWQSERMDLAIIHVANIQAPLLVLNIEDPTPADKVWTVGYPGQAESLRGSDPYQPAVKGGVVSKLEAVGLRKTILHDADMKPGNSGGPLINDCNQVIGVNTFLLRDTQGVEGRSLYSVSIQEAVEPLRQLNISIQTTGEPCITGNLQVEEKIASLSRQVLVWGLLIAVLLAITLGLALRRPRERIIEVVKSHSKVVSRSGKKGGMALTGFDTHGHQLKVAMDVKALDSENGGFTIGRYSALVDKVIDQSDISKRHLRFFARDKKYWVEDLNSANGTILNGYRLQPFKALEFKFGDSIRIGKLDLRVSGA